MPTGILNLSSKVCDRNTDLEYFWLTIGNENKTTVMRDTEGRWFFCNHPEGGDIHKAFWPVLELMRKEL